MADSKNAVVFGIYKGRAQAEIGVAQLIQEGFSSADISALLQAGSQTRDFAHEKNTKAPEGTAAGVTAGGAVGGTLGLLAGIGAITIPGIGPFLAAGPLMTTLAGLGAGGAVGGLIGAIAGVGIPEYEAKHYEGRVKSGGTLVSVHCDTSDEVKHAKQVLEQSGAEDISSSGEEHSDRDSYKRDHGYDANL